jgi:DNA (cytosine-5)-methyltransferase 1
MGFEHGDRKWDIPVSDTQAYRQFGNAVVVPVVETIARYMEPSISRMLGMESIFAPAREMADVG